MAMTWPPPQTLHEEHLEFAQSADSLRRVADAVGLIPLGELRGRICDVYERLTRQVIPHAMAEDQFPLAQVTGRLTGGQRVSDPLTREHLEIAQLLAELDALRWELAYPMITLAQEQALRRVLYGLYALMRVHLVGEEECICGLTDQAAAQGS
ncbi:MAG: hemerythrin domain-containing protein [Actinomycetota bacterium]